jgi:hypothetical protein
MEGISFQEVRSILATCDKMNLSLPSLMIRRCDVKSKNISQQRIANHKTRARRQSHLNMGKKRNK